ncbi:hypothetical protein [Microbispora sp. NPDC049125]|uniref:hypothetical protein n=1 Tax=Microbispora sp. NPDC049125 TaxID=3154929 RepID=UPI00346603D9
MTLHICSLKVETAQAVPVLASDYYLLRFPYTVSDESWDPHNMHRPTQPGGAVSTFPDARSGLIWPTVSGWGCLTAMVYWDAGSSSEYRARFVRDPLSLTTGYDSTATTDDAPTPGGQYRHYSHAMFVHPNTPIGLMVRHAASTPLAVTLAELKLAIEDNVTAVPPPPPLLPGKTFP